MVSEYTGITFAEGTSVGMGQVMEFYVNFGTAGVVVGFILLGMLIRFLDMRIAERLQTANWPQFALWFGVGPATLQPIGQLLEITSSMAGAARPWNPFGPLFRDEAGSTAQHVAISAIKAPPDRLAAR